MSLRERLVRILVAVCLVAGGGASAAGAMQADLARLGGAQAGRGTHAMAPAAPRQQAATGHAPGMDCHGAPAGRSPHPGQAPDAGCMGHCPCGAPALATALPALRPSLPPFRPRLAAWVPDPDQPRPPLFRPPIA